MLLAPLDYFKKLIFRQRLPHNDWGHDGQSKRAASRFRPTPRPAFIPAAARCIAAGVDAWLWRPRNLFTPGNKYIRLTRRVSPSDLTTRRLHRDRIEAAIAPFPPAAAMVGLFVLCVVGRQATVFSYIHFKCTVIQGNL